MATADEHLQALLKLPVEDRARVAQLLLESLDEEEDPRAESLRAAELARRIKTVEDGTAEILDAAEVRSRIDARIRALRGQ
jgi:hypothetical protein